MAEKRQINPNKEGEDEGKKPKYFLVGAWVHAWATASGTIDIRARSSYPIVSPRQTSRRGKKGTTTLVLKQARGLIRHGRVNSTMQ